MRILIGYLIFMIMSFGHTNDAVNVYGFISIIELTTVSSLLMITIISMVFQKRILSRFSKECEWRFNTSNYKEQLSQLKSMVKGNLN